MKKHFIPTFRLSALRVHTSLSNGWLLGVGVAFLATIAVVIYAGVAFFGAFSTDVASTHTDAILDTISREDLSRSVSIVEARRRDFERLKVEPPILPDPSR